VEVVEDRENLEVDDLTEPSIHKKIIPTKNMERMYERDDWRDDFKNPYE